MDGRPVSDTATDEGQTEALGNGRWVRAPGYATNKRVGLGRDFIPRMAQPTHPVSRAFHYRHMIDPLALPLFLITASPQHYRKSPLHCTLVLHPAGRAQLLSIYTILHMILKYHMDGSRNPCRVPPSLLAHRHGRPVDIRAGLIAYQTPSPACKLYKSGSFSTELVINGYDRDDDD